MQLQSKTLLAYAGRKGIFVLHNGGAARTGIVICENSLADLDDKPLLSPRRRRGRRRQATCLPQPVFSVRVFMRFRSRQKICPMYFKICLTYFKICPRNFKRCPTFFSPHAVPLFPQARGMKKEACGNGLVTRSRTLLVLVWLPFPGRAANGRGNAGCAPAPGAYCFSKRAAHPPPGCITALSTSFLVTVCVVTL